MSSITGALTVNTISRPFIAPKLPVSLRPVSIRAAVEGARDGASLNSASLSENAKCG
jgi:hypothetical protein